MKKQYGTGFVIGYIFLAFFCCIMVEFTVFTYLGAPANDEMLGIIFEIPTMGAFIIGAIYLFGGGASTENDNSTSSEKLPDDDGDDE